MELKGSFTIESALLMPLLLGTIVLLLYMSFFLHDRTVITEGAIILANRYTNERELSNAEITNKLQEQSKQVVDQKVIATKEIGVEIKVEDNKITVSCNGTFYFPSMYIVKTIFNKNYAISVSKSMKREDPVHFIRVCRMIEDLIN